MEHIKNIEIKNFKSIRHQKIEDCRRVNVFIGYPNVGKSNILEALSLFSIDESNLNFSSFIRIADLTTLFFNGEIERQLEVRINDKHRFIGRHKDDAILLEEQFESENTSFEKNDEQTLYRDNSDKVWIKKNFQLGVGKEDKKNIFNYRNQGAYTDDKLSSIRKYHFLKEPKYSNHGFSQLNYPYGTNIFNIIQSNEDILNSVFELFETYGLSFTYDNRLQQYTILKKVGKKIFTIPYDLVADTLQRVIFYKATILSNKDSILLFEEPEAHMFPPYISKLTSDIILDKNDNQYFITTHSPFVINDFMEDLDVAELGVYAVGYEKVTGETIIRRLTDKELQEIYQYGVDLFFNLEDYLKHAVS